MAQILLEDVSLKIKLTKNGPLRFRDWLGEKFGMAGGEEVFLVVVLSDMNLNLYPGV